MANTKPPREHLTARARAFKWAAAPGGLVTPGPGTYKFKPQMVPGLVGGFSAARPKTDVEWQMFYASRKPGPQEYSPKNQNKINGGRISKATPKGMVDEQVYLNSFKIGPGQYNVNRDIKTNGGVFSTARPKSDVDWMMYHAAQMPGPGGYDQKSKAFTGNRSFSFMGKPIKGNYQTTISNAVLFNHSTVQVGPSRCRTDGAFGKQCTSTQRSMPSVSFGGGKSFEMHESNLSASIDWAKKAGARRNKREQKQQNRKEDADAMFERFFGYHPAKARQKPGKAMMRSKPRKKLQQIATPGPGAYTVQSGIASKLYKKSGASFSFPRD